MRRAAARSRKKPPLATSSMSSSSSSIISSSSSRSGSSRDRARVPRSSRTSRRASHLSQVIELPVDAPKQLIKTYQDKKVPFILSSDPEAYAAPISAKVETLGELDKQLIVLDLEWAPFKSSWPRNIYARRVRGPLPPLTKPGTKKFLGMPDTSGDIAYDIKVKNPFPKWGAPQPQLDMDLERAGKGEQIEYWNTTIKNVLVTNLDCVMARFFSFTPEILRRWYKRRGDEILNLALRLYFNQAVVVECWLSMACFWNWIILMMPPLKAPLVVYRGMSTAPFPTRLTNALVAVSGFWSTSAHPEIAANFTGPNCCLFEIHLPTGFPVLMIDEVSEVFHFYKEYELLLPYTMDTLGLAPTFAMQIFGVRNMTLQTSSTSRRGGVRTFQVIQLRPVLLPEDQQDPLYMQVVSKGREPSEGEFGILSKLFPSEEFTSFDASATPVDAKKQLKVLHESAKGGELWLRPRVDLKFKDWENASQPFWEDGRTLFNEAIIEGPVAHLFETQMHTLLTTIKQLSIPPPPHRKKESPKRGKEELKAPPPLPRASKLRSSPRKHV